MELLLISNFTKELYTLCDENTIDDARARAYNSYRDSFLMCKKNVPYDKEYYEKQAEKYRQIILNGFSAVTWEEYEKIQREKWLSKEAREITAEEYEYALNVLPPKEWIHNERYSMFFIGECTTMTFYGQYLYNKENGKYYSALTDMMDRNTWIDKKLGLA